MGLIEGVSIYSEGNGNIVTFETCKRRSGKKTKPKYRMQLTHSTPIEAMSNRVLGSSRVRGHSCVDVLYLGPFTGCIILRAAIINMNMSAH